MKACPACEQEFEDQYSFCPDDGGLLGPAAEPVSQITAQSETTADSTASPDTEAAGSSTDYAASLTANLESSPAASLTPSARSSRVLRY